MTLPTKDRPQKIGGVDLVEIYGYLDMLRITGVTNMFGAGIYLQDEYGLDKKEARTALVFWMEDFGKVDKSVP